MSVKTHYQSNLFENSNTVDFQRRNNSILNHLFLPHDLPSSAEADYLIKSNHENEHEILEFMDEYLGSLDVNDRLPIVLILENCVEKWLKIQNINICSVSDLQSIIQKLMPGDFLPLYFHAQNAAILIEIDENPVNQPLISSWQVSLPTETIVSSLEPHISYFPSPTYRLSDRSQLSTKSQCELLVDFLNNTIEYSKSSKSSREVDEIRDVPISHYVCQWWITQFQGIQIENQVNPSFSFTKKHRDQIRWKSALLPFRRSGLWMTIKAVFQTILTKHLGKIGTVIYKLLITDALTYFIYKRQIWASDLTSPDLLVYCLRKIVRRLNKIDGLLLSIDPNDMNKWIKNVTERIRRKLDQITPTSDWQEIIKRNEGKKYKIPLMIQLKLDQTDIYQHSCDKLKTYLTQKNSFDLCKQISNNYNFAALLNLHKTDQLPSFIELTNQANYSIGIALTRIEIWVQSYLNQWINHPLKSDSELSKNFENLLNFFVNYQNEALNHYHSKNNPSDPIGYSRFILTSLTIIRAMHQRLCADQRFKRLQLHSIHIPYLMELFEFLVLPTRDDMIRARDLFEFFHDFNRNKSYPDVLEDIKSTDAFGVYFATHSLTMIETLKEIGIQANNDKQAKIDEVKKAKEKYQELMNEAYSINCECFPFLNIRNCHRCSTIKQADSMKVHLYECPIPSEPKSASAVVFELQMPIEFRCYRDVLWMFINRFDPEPTTKMYEWLNVPPHGNKLNQFYKCSYICHVKLVSSIKSMTQTHYATPQKVGTTPLENFLFNNSLQVQITPSKSTTLQDECRTLTPQLNDPNYKHLQFSLDNTQFAQNQVIAEQSYCSLRLKLTQFIDFGSFRSGHRLQWWNLLTTLELESLPMDEESVAILINHALLQYGPVTTDSNALIQSWCSESHQILIEDHFIDELISRLDRLLTDCGSNWQNELVLVIVNVIVMRMFNICNSTRTDHVAVLIIKCREVGEKWIELISKSIQNGSSLGFDEMDLLRSKIVNIGVACLLTFSAPEDRNYYLLSSNQHIISLLKAATTVHDNIILNKKQSNMSSVFMRNLKRSTERILISIQPAISSLLKKISYQSLNEFSIMYWAGIKRNGIVNEKWKKRNEDIYDGWYDGQYQSTMISINCLTGTFLVNGMTIGFLPDKVTTNPLFARVFRDHVFEVQAGESNNVYITKYAYHGDRKIYYEFSFDDLNQRLIVQERHIKTNMTFELISPDCFETELPDIFVSNYSHWMNKDNQQVEFRPIFFQDPNFLTDKNYILTINTGFITTNNSENTQILIKRASSFFQHLFHRYFIRLDDEPYVYMLRENALQTDGIIYIHLSRLGIAFKYDAHKDVISSREYPDMYIDKDQWLGTLTGLNAGLLLSPIMIKNQTYKQCLCRKLIVPYGQIKVTRESDQDHHTVTIDRSSTLAEFLHQYFVFILNDRLRILQSTDSPTGSLYLALLHATTSHSLPDQYTGMTGMERAFQLLNSAGCWSGQPFDPLSLNILLQIATLSPKVNYYPEHLTCMEEIQWNSHGLPRSMQHFGYYLIAKKLFQESEQWNFMHPTSSSQEIFKSKKYNEKLLAKLYWDYRDSYNPTARLSAEMEAEIQSSSSTKSYQPVWSNYSQTANYGVIGLVDHLYSNGNVNLKSDLELKCFPLAQWLTSEYELKNIWIGLFQFVEEIKKITVINQRNEIERFEMLLDFLHYISNQCSIQPFYLQILKSALKTPNALLRSIPYPSFIQYENIEEITVQVRRLKFPKKLTRSNHPVAILEIQNCFDTNSVYTNQSFPQRGVDKSEINRLLISWRANAALRSFLNNIQNHVNKIRIFPLNTKINVICPQYTFESFSAHYQIKFYSQNKCVNQALLASALRKFLRPHTDYFIKPTASTRIINEQKQFPDQIFPSTDPKINSLSEIAKHYKEQLIESWRKLQSVENYRKQYPSIEEITTILIAFHEESTQLWNELVKSIISTNELLFETGLMLRIIPSTLISVFQQIWLNDEEQQLLSNKSSISSSKQIVNNRNCLPLFLTPKECTLLGGIMVNWIVEQQIERALHFANQDKWEDFEKEISNVPHVNWTPAKYVPWLILELEMNITIREIQVEVAHHMIKPQVYSQNIVMQMNMGEGKTSVILPMLALTLCSPSSSLVRMIVLKSLFPMNYQSLRYKLGGLLNRRVLPFACRRDMNFNNIQINQIFDHLQQGLKNCDVVLTSPEDILSFDLLTIDKCRRHEFDTSRSMLCVQRWLKKFARDVLDESDEILHVKYQLIYSIGGQQQVDGGMERWQTIQLILDLVKQHAADIAKQYTDDVFYKASKRQSNFSEFRLLSHRPFPELCKRVANDWLKQKSYRKEDQDRILSFILETNSSVDCLINRFPFSIIQLFLILRGLLSSEVLLVALKKRYRVKFGVNQNPKFNRLIAVPFRAKDVATENTEFGHPDISIILTQLSYYYNGLNDSQMLQCFNRLNQIEKDSDVIYADWILYEGKNNVDSSIQHWKGVNIKDQQQRTEHLFPTLRQNMLVVNYYLNHFVFPREAKQFPEKLVASAWDLSSSLRTKIITGFSGTNDTQLLLPIHIQQNDLAELRKTDAIVLNNLLQSENEKYEFLSVTASSDEILKQIVNYKPMTQVILDIGALFVDGTNYQIAKKWLNLSDKDKIDYAIYFESDEIYVCDRLYPCHAFSTSPASERLERCVFYLDEIHTRGTDFKFPDGFRAAVTLGNGLSKDRLVQACMRMRKLGTHHWLSFWSSNEVHLQIQALKNNLILSSKSKMITDQITLNDILRWVYENTQYTIWDGLHHWAAQSFSFQRKTAAFKSINWNNHQESFTDKMMTKLATDCVETEVLELKLMYGVPKSLQTVSEIYRVRYKNLGIINSSNEIHEAVDQRLSNYGGTKKLLAQLLDEEQQRELEQELEEERQQEPPLVVQPYEPILHNEIKSLCDVQGPALNLSQLTSVFSPLPDAFRGTTFYLECQARAWQRNLWVSTEFIRVVQTKGESLDPFLRPPRWIVIYRNTHIIFVSPYEANWLMQILHKRHNKKQWEEPTTTTLRLLLPRIRRDQSILVNNPALTIPPSIVFDHDVISFLIAPESLVGLFVFNGTLYFETDQEQTAYCQFLGVCPKPRTVIEEIAFENGLISVDGFVGELTARTLLKIGQCRFNSNPLLLVRKLVENRNNTHAPLKSHVGGIILNATKHIFQSS